MKSYYLKIEKVYGETKILIEKKKIKNVHLKVYRNLTVRCSFPESASDEYIEKFFSTRIGWINKQLSKYKEALGVDNLECIKDGSCFQILGKDYRIFIKQGEKNEITENEKSITIYTKDTNKIEQIRREFTTWWRIRARQVFGETLKELFNKVIKKYGFQMPTLNIRSMKTMWGSYNKNSNSININDYLLKANMLQIQYVILHELTHMKYKYHNQDFYNFMTIHMPDWQERKKTLDSQVAQGI
jgi:predicted metal-dependent hydrolase